MNIHTTCVLHTGLYLVELPSFRADDLLFARTRLPFLHRAGRTFLGMVQNSPQRCLWHTQLFPDPFQGNFGLPELHSNSLVLHWKVWDRIGGRVPSRVHGSTHTHIEATLAVLFICSQTKSFRLKTVNFRVEQPETHRDTEKKTAGLWDKQGQSYLYVKTAHFHVRVLYTRVGWRLFYSMCASRGWDLLRRRGFFVFYDLLFWLTCRH